MATVTVNEEKFHVTDVGSGAPLLLVHGFPLDHSMWDAQIRELSPDLRVIAPDLRGFGNSAVTPGCVTMEQHADDLAAILDNLDVQQPVTLCGLSMGGYIAWQFWHRHRDRLAALVLCDTRAIDDTLEAAENRIAMARQVVDDGTGFVADAMLPKLVGDETFQAHPEVVEAIRAMILGAPPEGVAAAQRGMAERPDVTAWLPQITTPSLVVVGADDVISPSAEMRAIADALPNSRFVEIPRAGHMTPMENPGDVNEAIHRFIKEISQ